MNIQENAVLKRTVVGSDCCFSTICAVVTFRVKVCIMSVDCTLYSTYRTKFAKPLFFPNLIVSLAIIKGKNDTNLWEKQYAVWRKIAAISFFII